MYPGMSYPHKKAAVAARDEYDDDEYSIVMEEEEETPYVIYCRQLLFSALDSAIISSEVFTHGELFILSQVCRACNDIVRQRTKTLSGNPLVMKNLKHQFPGVRNLVVNFNEVSFNEQNDAREWSIHSSLVGGKEVINLLQLKSLTIKVGSYFNTKVVRAKKQLASRCTIADPIAYIQPFIPPTLDSLGIIIKHETTMDMLSDKDIFHRTTNLKNLKIEAFMLAWDQIKSILLPVIQQQKLQHLQSLELSWSPMAGAARAATTPATDPKFFLALLQLKELHSVTLRGHLEEDRDFLADYLTATNCDLTRFKKFSISDSTVTQYFYRFLSANTLSHQLFGATLMCSSLPGTHYSGKCYVTDYSNNHWVNNTNVSPSTGQYCQLTTCTYNLINNCPDQYHHFFIKTFIQWGNTLFFNKEVYGNIGDAKNSYTDFMSSILETHFQESPYKDDRVSEMLFRWLVSDIKTISEYRKKVCTLVCTVHTVYIINAVVMMQCSLSQIHPVYFSPSSGALTWL